VALDDAETVRLRADKRVYSRNQMASLQDDQRSPPGERITDLQEIEPSEVAVA